MTVLLVVLLFAAFVAVDSILDRRRRAAAARADAEDQGVRVNARNLERVRHAPAIVAPASGPPASLTTRPRTVT